MKKRKPLTGKARNLASKYIAEEERTSQYPHKQAIAIGIARARSKVKKDRAQQEFSRLCRKYGIRA